MKMEALVLAAPKTPHLKWTNILNLKEFKDAKIYEVLYILYQLAAVGKIFWVLCILDHASSWYLSKERPTWCHLLYYFLFNVQHVSDVNTSILRSLRLICWVISWVVLLWFDVCWCYVMVWLWWCGIRMQAEALKCFSLHTDTTPPQPNHNVTPTHIEPEQYNPWNNSRNKSQAPEDGCINIRNMLNIK